MSRTEEEYVWPTPANERGSCGCAVGAALGAKDSDILSD